MMKKGGFLIATQQGTRYATGYIDRDTGLAVSKSDDGKGWVCSDYRTGYRLNGGLTRQDAIDRAMRHLDDVRANPVYATLQTINEI